MDFLDFCNIAFDNAEGQIDPIALNRCNGRDDLDAIQALVDVLALEFLLGLVGQRLVKGLTVCNARIAQRLFQHILVKLLGADKVHVSDGRTLFNNHDQHITADFKPHVLEQTQTEQGTNGAGALVIVVGFAYAEWQRGKDGARLNTLQTFDPDILDGEGIYSPGGIDEKQAGSDSADSTNFELIDLLLHELEGS